MKILPVICIILLLTTACSYNAPAADYGTPADTRLPEAAHEEYTTASSTVHDIATQSVISPTPSEMPFERINVMNQPKIVVKKQERMLYIYDDDNLCAKFKIALGFAPEGHKMKEGDGKTPEGLYYICTKNDKSKYYLALAISYPNIDDAKSGLERGIITEDEYMKIEKAIGDGKRPPWDTALGGEIMIHGSDASSDWTAGCLAAENDDIDYLWENCPVGTPVEIVP